MQHPGRGNEMRKWIYILLASFLMLLYRPPSFVMADAQGVLTADSKKENITVTLKKPAGENDAVTSLRFWMYVSVSEGSTKQPSFQFSEALKSSEKIVSSAAVTKQGSVYTADIVVAVKDFDIFKNGGQAVIGTLTLQPSDTFRAQAGLAGVSGAQSGQPVLQYVSARGQAVQSVPIAGVRPVECTKSADGTAQNPSGPSDSQGTVIPNLPVTSGQGTPGQGTPGQTGTPGQDGTQTVPGEDESQTPGTDTGAKPGSGQDSAQTFDKKKALTLKLSVKNSTGRITFKWSRAAGADGYQIYQYDPDTGKSRRIKTILNPDKTSYSKEMEYGTAYSFRVRAFQTLKNNKRSYGRFSRVMHTVTAPAKVTGVNISRRSLSKTVISWKIKGAAEGFQIYRSTGRNGKYTRIKTIAKGTARKYTGIRQTRGRVYYYKVRAYVTGTDGKRIYGKFSSVKKM